jgi:nucleotide-binding universal stress UspA family protein
MELDTIIVLTDFSAIAANAMKYSISLAELFKAKLIVTHFYFKDGISDEEYASELKLKEQKLAKLKKELQITHPSFPVETRIENRDVIETLQGLVNKEGGDLIILGAKSAWFEGDKMLGRLASEVIGKAGAPVLAVPCNAIYKGIRRLIYASDVKNNDISALKLLSDFARLFAAEITVLDISDQGRISEDELFRFERKVREVAQYPKLDFIYFSGPELNKHFQEFTERNSTDILVMTVSERSAAGKNLLSGDSQKVGYHQHLPILAFHEKVL